MEPVVSKSILTNEQAYSPTIPRATKEYPNSTLKKQHYAGCLNFCEDFCIVERIKIAYLCSVVSDVSSYRPISCLCINTAGIALLVLGLNS